MWRVVVLLTTLLAVNSQHAAFAQSLVLPPSMNRTLYRPSARSIGMGGTYLLALDDATSLAFNPALLGNAGRYSFAVEAGARTDNIPWDKFDELQDDLDALRDAIAEGGSAAVDAVLEAFNRLYNFALDAGAQVGEPGLREVSGEVDPFVGFSVGSVGAVLYGGEGLSVGLGISEGTGPDADKRTVTVSAGALQLVTVEVGHAFRWGAGRMGVGLKHVRSRYTGYALGADASTNSITGAHVQRTDDGGFDLDLGYITDPLPLKGLDGPGLQLAGVVRHLISPEFSVPLEITRVVGPPVDVPANSDFRLNPQFDLGTAVPFKRLLVAMELHNVSGTNGGQLTFHVGGEYRLLKWLRLRAGYDDDKFVGGVGVAFGPVRLDVATATDPRERVYASLSVRVQ
jgi:hypothetical protein